MITFSSARNRQTDISSEGYVPSSHAKYRFQNNVAELRYFKLRNFSLWRSVLENSEEP